MSNEFEVKFQRDLNRIIDSDRNTRKRGLQKLLDDVPWTNISKLSTESKETFYTFVKSTLLKLLLSTIADPVEKCREITLAILQKVFSTIDIEQIECLPDLVKKLCKRVGENPFPETAEELRLQVLDILLKIYRNLHKNPNETPDLDGTILESLCKSLSDGFSAVKRSGAELISQVAKSSPGAVRLYLKLLLKGLVANVLHQHAKTRVVTLQAIGNIMTCATQTEYESNMSETVLTVFGKLLSDRSAAVKIELALQCQQILSQKLKEYRALGASISAVDLELVVVLLLLSGDLQSEVSEAAVKALEEVSVFWHTSLKVNVDRDLCNDVEDGEMELQKLSMPVEEEVAVAVNVTSSHRAVEGMIQDSFPQLSASIIRGMEEWTTESKTRYLRGFVKLIEYGEDTFLSSLPLFFLSLSNLIKEEDADIRVAAEKCCARIGTQIHHSHVLPILLPRVLGEVPGGDTASQRTGALRVLTHALVGFPACLREEEEKGEEKQSLLIVEKVSHALSQVALYEFREAALREAVLLLVRSLLSTFPAACAANPSARSCIALSLLFLSGKAPGEDDIVHNFAHIELVKFAVFVQNTSAAPSDVAAAAVSPPVADNAALSQLLRMHFEELFSAIVGLPSPFRSLPAAALDDLTPRWDARSPGKTAFEVLVRDCPGECWRQHRAVLPVFRNQVQPPVKPAAGSAEANALSYAAQRGEEAIPSSVNEHVDLRLGLLVLLEGFIRAGASDWQCGAFLSEAAEGIVKEMLVPNMIWKIGRVEATVRKVALAAAYGLLKAGALRMENLARCATELVPLVVSNLDDMESTPRQIACLCLTVIFERLRGAFGDNAVREMYPKLIARLDDSNDAVRVSACHTLQMFLQCAHKSNFQGTTIDYILDQLFIHLDDPDPAIQEAVLPVIVVAANNVDKELALKKAENSKNSHRSPALCQRIISEVQGFEILED